MATTHTNWRDQKFDALLKHANLQVDPARRLALLREAEQYIQQAMPVMPLYVYTRSRMLKPYIRGHWENYQDRHPFKYLWIDRSGEAPNTLPNFFEDTMSILELISTLMLTGLIWTIQVVHYPLFANVGMQEFQMYHRKHARNISGLVIPLMFAELIAVLWNIQNHSSIALFPFVSASLLGIAWLSTFTLQVPIHRKLSTEATPASLRRLVRTNWLRTIAWSGRSVLLIAGLQHRGFQP